MAVSRDWAGEVQDGPGAACSARKKVKKGSKNPNDGGVSSVGGSQPEGVHNDQSGKNLSDKISNKTGL